MDGIDGVWIAVTLHLLDEPGSLGNGAGPVGLGWSPRGTEEGGRRCDEADEKGKRYRVEARCPCHGRKQRVVGLQAGDLVRYLCGYTGLHLHQQLKYSGAKVPLVACIATTAYQLGA